MSMASWNIGSIVSDGGKVSGARKSARSWQALAAVFALLLAAGCGGSGKKEVAQPDDDGMVDEDDDGVAGDELMPEEKLDEVQRFFDRKRTVMTRCFTSAIEQGEIAKNANGQVTITMTIAPSGQVKNVRIADIKPRSQSFERCVVDTASEWTVTTLPKALDYSFSYGFGTL